MVWRIVLVSLVPLLVIGGANSYLFYSLNRSTVIKQHAAALGSHRESIEAFLQSNVSMVVSLANQYSLAELLSGNLERLFQVIQHRESVFTDVGIIDSLGNHIKYIGPYQLSKKNYKETDWFRQVVNKGTYISDVFLGFRKVPHFIMAVRKNEGDSYWILRATVSTSYFNKLVSSVQIGESGETFIVNSQGQYQTSSRRSALLSKTEYPHLERHDGIHVEERETKERNYLYTTTWLRSVPWLLIFRQEISDVYQPLQRASIVGILMFAIGTMGAIFLAVIVARKQIRLIQRADKEKENLTQKLLLTGKTAAVGEMSAGLAHEINNPLAIIETLQTWIRDLSSDSPVKEEDRLEIISSTMKIGEQVARCKVITQGLLKFARRVEAPPDTFDLNALIEELMLVARTRARVEGVTLESILEPLPAIFAPPAHLQQILANLVNNAIDATAKRSDGKVTIHSHKKEENIILDIMDNGCGIDEKNLSRIFLPFFTTKAVGKGTGLGLAICYGLAQDLGGALQVKSVVGSGTTFSVILPLAGLMIPPQEKV
jgi:two-component system, NtrC family, sensor kinase